MSNCPAAWHSERSVGFLVSANNCSLEACPGDKSAIFLKPSKGTMSISATFNDIVVSDSFLGCRLSIKMGRLDCSTAPYNIKITSLATFNAGPGVRRTRTKKGELLIVGTLDEERGCDWKRGVDVAVTYG
jgi:hypothetical protein